jgi:hypothetical protein
MFSPEARQQYRLKQFHYFPDPQNLLLLQKKEVDEAKEEMNTIRKNRLKDIPYRKNQLWKDVFKKRKYNVVSSCVNNFQMDIAYFVEPHQAKDKKDKEDKEDVKQLLYLFLIGTVNKYTEAECIKDRSVKSIKEALGKIIDRLQREYYIIDCDREKAFIVLEYSSNIHTINWLLENNITIHANKDKYHVRLSVINRLIRTIRDYNYFLTGIKNELIEPEQMKIVLKYYNLKPHERLSKLIGFPVCPLEVIDDIDMEALIARKLIQENEDIRKSNTINIGDIVSVYHKPKPFEKVRYKNNTKPDNYKVIGFEGRNVKLENTNKHRKEEEEERIITVPRMFLH